MYRDCDHLLSDKNIYTIRGNWDDSSEVVLVKLVYEKTMKSQDFCKVVDKCDGSGEILLLLNPKNFRHISCKGIKLSDFQGNSIWDRIARELVELGIDENNIGIFGSKRLNFSAPKDVDFVIYGRENMLRVKKNIDLFKSRVGLYNHTFNHAKYQAETHGKFLSKERNNLLMCLIRKWSSCSVNENLTVTLRFVDDLCTNGDELKSFFLNRDGKETVTFRGSVSGADNTSFMPRRFFLTDISTSVEVVSPLWIFHQCVRDNDFVEVTGTPIDNKIWVWRGEHGIKHL